MGKLQSVNDSVNGKGKILEHGNKIETRKLITNLKQLFLSMFPIHVSICK